MRLASGVIVTQNPQSTLEELQAARTDELLSVIDTEGKEFLIEHATEAIAKAYLTSDEQNYIILIAPRFSAVSQNRLLKIIEEPPRNKHFILITESKSSILPTIKSRLPIHVRHDTKVEEAFALDLNDLNLAKVYEFVQQNSRLSSVECKQMIEKISIEAIKSGRYHLDEGTLKLVSDGIQALEMGSPTSFVLNTVLLKLLAKKKR
ncbi:MAG: DNA polymerase III subunit delta' [Campylobacterales bacterium]|nr:DNA polymerase III subunit delta' [Campylobacterales bacterium]